jgi:hypothetical protein
VHDNDVGIALAKTYGIRLCRSIPEALCLGDDELAVDGVLSIAEQGVYATNEKGQQLYGPRPTGASTVPFDEEPQESQSSCVL